MEERGSEAAAKPGTVSRRLQSNLDRSIEAHRLRLQKARSTKTDKHGRLCECKNCDVTSMKPSMRCLASGAAKPQLGTNNEKLPRRSAGSLEKVTVKGGTSQCGRQRCTAEKPAPMVPTTRRAADTIRGKVDVKRDNVTEELRRPSCLPLERNEVYAVEEQHVVSSRSTGKYSTVRPVEVSRDVEQGLSSGRAQYATGGCEDVSALSRCSSARTKYDGRASDVSPTTDAQVDGVTRRLESIRVSESAREHYQLDTAELESRILDIVDKVVTHRLNEVKDNGVASKGEDCRGDVEIPAVKASNSQEQTSVTSGERSPTHVTVGSIDSIGTAQTSAQKEASVTSDHNESPGKYKSVVDILLNYISCSPVGRPKPGTDQTKNVKVTATQTSFTPKISYMAQTVGEFRQATGNLHASKSSDMSWESGVVGSRACHNGVAEGNVVKTECGAMGGVTMPHTEVTNHYRASNAAPSGRQQVYVPHGNAVPGHVSHMQAGNVYSNGPAPQMYAGYPYPVQYAPPAHAYNPAMNYRGLVMAPMMGRQVAPMPRRQPIVRRNNTSASMLQQARVTQTQATTPKVAGRQYAYNGVTPRATGYYNPGWTTASQLQSPMRMVQRQGTGSLYRRNTGRAYAQQVQAAMI